MGIDALIPVLFALMVQWKVTDISPQEKEERYKPLVRQIYQECQKYEHKTKVKAHTCTLIATNLVYWESGFQLRVQLTPKVGPSGEECYFQIHRSAGQIPFPEWKPLHEYGTRHGPDTRRCVQDGVRILSYHMWRCGYTERKLRNDPLWQLFQLYSQYHYPDPECRHRPHKNTRFVWSRASMAKRILSKL